MFSRFLPNRLMFAAGKLRKLLWCAGLLPALLHFAAAGAELPVQWGAFLGSSIDSSPAIATNGTLYITCSGYTNYKDFSGGKLVAISPEGKVYWEFKVLCDIKSSPAIGGDGTIYFGARDRKVYAISSRGQAKWTFDTAEWIDSSPGIATNGTVYFGGWDKKFYALNPDGSKKWEFVTGGPIDSSPAIAADGTIYFGSHDKKFYALNPDGSAKWVFTTGGAIISSPALNCDGTIYFTSTDGNLYVLNSGGGEKWRLKTGGVRESSPVIDAGGNIYLGVNNTFQCISAAGTKKWYFGYPTVDGAPAVSEDGLICIAATTEGVGALLAFRAAGGDPLVAKLGYPTGTPVAIGRDGRIYAGAGGRLFAIKGNAGLAKSCWPKFRGDAAQTGRINTE